MVFRGEAAHTIIDSAQNALMDFLRARLNAAPYAARLGKAVVVTPSEEHAAALYQGGQNGQPFVEVLTGAMTRHRFGETQPDGEVKRGARWEMTFLLDMSTSDHAAGKTGPTRAVASDRKLIDAVNDIIGTNRDALRAVGLEACLCKPDDEAQRHATKRNPHVVTCQAFAVYD